MPQTCETCLYFVQHYRKSSRRYDEVACGHCTRLRVKKRTKDMSACEQYREKKVVRTAGGG